VNASIYYYLMTACFQRFDQLTTLQTVLSISVVIFTEPSKNHFCFIDFSISRNPVGTSLGCLPYDQIHSYMHFQLAARSLGFRDLRNEGVEAPNIDHLTEILIGHEVNCQIFLPLKIQYLQNKVCQLLPCPIKFWLLSCPCICETMHCVVMHPSWVNGSHNKRNSLTFKNQQHKPKWSGQEHPSKISLQVLRRTSPYFCFMSTQIELRNDPSMRRRRV
jgi:hypothetical protein